MIKKLNEKDLLQRISNNDSRAFAMLFHHYYRDLTLYAGHYISDQDSCEDIVQTVFIQLWADRSKVSQIISLKSYLLKIIQNHCIDFLRHQNIKQKYADLKAIHDKNITWETEEYILYSELQDRLQKALNHLTPIQKQCFVMHRMQGMKQTEISEKLGIPLRTVELRIAEALKILKQQLQEYFLIVILLLFP